MLINKMLAAKGYIFVKNADPLYIKALANLGSKPIFTYIKDNERIISKGIIFNNCSQFRLLQEEFIKNHCNWFNPVNYNIFNFDCCSISEIKKILSAQMLNFNDMRSYLLYNPFYIEPFYFFND